MSRHQSLAQAGASSLCNIPGQSEAPKRDPSAYGYFAAGAGEQCRHPAQQVRAPRVPGQGRASPALSPSPVWSPPLPVLVHVEEQLGGVHRGGGAGVQEQLLVLGQVLGRVLLGQPRAVQELTLQQRQVRLQEREGVKAAGLTSRISVLGDRVSGSLPWTAPSMRCLTWGSHLTSSASRTTGSTGIGTYLFLRSFRSVSIIILSSPGYQVPAPSISNFCLFLMEDTG